MDMPDENGKTALHYVASVGSEKNLASLMAKPGRFDPNRLDYNGDTPLLLAMDMHLLHGGDDECECLSFFFSRKEIDVRNKREMFRLI